MNSRLQQLIRDADDYCDQMGLEGQDSYHTEWSQKFAELLVKDCVAMIKGTMQYHLRREAVESDVNEAKLRAEGAAMAMLALAKRYGAKE